MKKSSHTKKENIGTAIVIGLLSADVAVSTLICADSFMDGAIFSKIKDKIAKAKADRQSETWQFAKEIERARHAEMCKNAMAKATSTVISMKDRISRAKAEKARHEVKFDDSPIGHVSPEMKDWLDKRQVYSMKDLERDCATE